jgi:hypothetical protein
MTLRDVSHGTENIQLIGPSWSRDRQLLTVAAPDSACALYALFAKTEEQQERGLQAAFRRLQAAERRRDPG